MENNLAQLLMECQREIQPPVKPPNKASTKDKEIAVKPTQELLNNTIDLSYFNMNIDEILKNNEDVNVSNDDKAKELPKVNQNNRAVYGNDYGNRPSVNGHDQSISFHLFEENQSKKQVKSISEKNEDRLEFSVFQRNNYNNNKDRSDNNSNNNNNISDNDDPLHHDTDDMNNFLNKFDCNHNKKDNNKKSLHQIKEESFCLDDEAMNQILNDNEEYEANNNNNPRKAADNAKQVDLRYLSIDNLPNKIIPSQSNQNQSFDASFVERKCQNHQLADLTEWNKPFDWDEEVIGANKHVFGFNGFRPNQKEIINANLAGRDIFVCMPTGGGKSLTFQIPAIIQFGVTVIVMPLLSLIQDQTSFLAGLGIKAIFLNNEGMNEVNTNYNQLFHSDNEEELCKLIFVTPEKISQSQLAKNFLQRLNNEKLLKRVVIDEAHCVSQWGREFRPDYLSLKILKRLFPLLPILAVTATAPNKIREDVISQLGMTDTLFFRSSYNRTNLFIEIRNKKECSDVVQHMAEFIKNNYPTSTGLIYCSSKKKCEKICEKLKKHFRLNCAFYHASLPEKKKNDIQDKWKNDEIKIIIATVAFGMGINKADVRFVIHEAMPKSFEGYYQEIGRAGRDGNRSHCILYYSSQDRKIIEFLMTKTNLNFNQITENLRKTTEMAEYCEEVCECRRVIALLYFDEKFNRQHCKRMCDNCAKGLQPEEKDVTDSAMVILSFLNNCHKESIPITLAGVVDYLRGVRKQNNKKLPLKDCNGGALNHIKDDDLKKIIRRLIIQKYIDEFLVTIPNNVYTRLEISNEGMEYLRVGENNSKRIIVSFPSKGNKKESNEENNNDERDYKSNKKNNNAKENDNKKNEEGNNAIASGGLSCSGGRNYKRNYEDKKEISINEKEIFNSEENYGLCSPIQFHDLLTQLKIKRFDLLSEERRRLLNISIDGNVKKITLDDIFTENGLKELCRKLPTTQEELTPNNIYGIAPKILERFGKEFLYTIQKVMKLYDIVKDPKAIEYNMNNINSSRLKRTNQKERKQWLESYKKNNDTQGRVKLTHLLEEEYPDDIKQEESKVNDNAKERQRQISNNDQPIDIDLSDIDNILKANACEIPNDDFDYFNNEDDQCYPNDNGNNGNNGNNIEEDEEEIKRKEMLSLCKDAKELYKNEKKKRKTDTEDIDIENDSHAEKKVKKDNSKANYFKMKAKWNKINQAKKNKKNKFI